MKVQLVQLNSIVGDFEGNYAKMAKSLRAAGNADLVIFPECALCGYPPQDLLDYPEFAQRAEHYAQRLVTEFSRQSFIFGSIEKNEDSGRPLRNIAVVALKGRIDHRYRKRLLPSYDVFDEDRFFEPGRSPLLFEFLGKKVALTICEDIWADDEGTPLHNRYAQNPVLESSSADVLINISASPYEYSKVLRKREMLSGVAQRHKIPLIYVNAVGANDSIIFDGRSYFFDAKGSLILQGKAFAEDEISLDLVSPPSTTMVRSAHDEVADIYDALKLGILDYCQKQNFNSVILGSSGGIDSALLACLAVDALGVDNVVSVLLPSRYTSAESNEDALALARVMQNPVHVIPIEYMFSAGLTSLSQAFQGLEPGLTEENLQSRIRGTLLMALSNKFGHLLLTTGNKSELATGYCTLYGDMNGGLAPLSDVYKTQVYALSQEANRRWKRIPDRVFTKAPSAELRPDQKDQDTLPPYERLDQILRLILEEFVMKEGLIKKGFAEEEVDRILNWISKSEFKRYQMPLGLKVSPKSFGIGRRIPIVQRAL